MCRRASRSSMSMPALSRSICTYRCTVRWLTSSSSASCLVVTPASVSQRRRNSCITRVNFSPDSYGMTTNLSARREPQLVAEERQPGLHLLAPTRHEALRLVHPVRRLHLRGGLQRDAASVAVLRERYRRLDQRPPGTAAAIRGIDAEHPNVGLVRRNRFAPALLDVLVQLDGGGPCDHAVDEHDQHDGVLRPRGNVGDTRQVLLPLRHLGRGELAVCARGHLTRLGVLLRRHRAHLDLSCHPGQPYGATGWCRRGPAGLRSWSRAPSIHRPSPGSRPGTPSLPSS